MPCRQELVTGNALPTQEELKEWQEAGGAHQEDGGSSIKGVPYFYLTVLCNQVNRCHSCNHPQHQQQRLTSRQLEHQSSCSPGADLTL